MNRAVPWWALVVVALATATWSQPQKNPATEKAVADLEQQWLKSQQTNNAALVEPLLADGFTNTSSDGKVSDRAQALADAKASKYSSADYLDVKVKVFGDTAIAVGNFRGKGTDPSGKPFDTNERFTDTWVKMPGGKWQCVASHQSPVKM
ncbi:MAG TPA: nuclear transport factor 2 family protein [Terriglobales bacterium]|nr:nuclear transport factor 2 family protein [Terriglobales bacterium]